MFANGSFKGLKKLTFLLTKNVNASMKNVPRTIDKVKKSGKIMNDIIRGASVFSNAEAGISKKALFCVSFDIPLNE